MRLAMVTFPIQVFFSTVHPAPFPTFQANELLHVQASFLDFSRIHGTSRFYGLLKVSNQNAIL